MNLFEAIFVRKSVRSYTNEGISRKFLEDILKQFDEINGLFGGVETELAIFDNRQNDYKMLSLLGIKAPYYLVLYSEEKRPCDDERRVSDGAAFVIYVHQRNRKLFYRQSDH